jgi:membrane-associated HD superfamily phosphohydrolase
MLSTRGGTILGTQRKEIILNEILFWKQNHLLPAHYCDFLMALYAQGESVDEKYEVKDSKSILAKEKKKKIIVLTLILVITFTVLVLLFTMNTLSIIPIVVSCMLAVVLLIVAIKLSHKTILMPIIFISSALLILGLSFKIWLVYFSDNPFILLGLVSGNCLVWFISGLLLKLPYFTLSGAIGFLLVIVFILFS